MGAQRNKLEGYDNRNLMTDEHATMQESDVLRDNGTRWPLGEPENLLPRLFSLIGLGFASYEIGEDGQGSLSDYKVRAVNTQFEILTGLSRNYLIGKRGFEVWTNVIGPSSRWMATLEEVASTGGETTFETYSESNGIWFKVWALGISARGLVTVIEDITLRRVEQNIAQLGQERLEALLNAATDFACLLDREGKILALNRGMAEQFGRQKDELVGRSIFELFAEDLVRGRKPRFEEVTNTGLPVREQDERYGRTYDYTLYPVFSPDGDVAGVAVCAKDITEEKKARELMLNAERMKAVGEMSAGVAHNFTNVLQVVMGRAQLALENFDRGKASEAVGHLEAILASAESGSKTLEMLSRFAGSRELDTESQGTVFDLSAAVAAAIEMSKTWWKIRPEREGVPIRLKENLRKGCMVKGREKELFEVALNLIKNAVDAVSGGGTIIVETFLENGEAVLTVRDTGSGIDEKNLGRVFEPFWSTK